MPAPTPAVPSPASPSSAAVAAALTRLADQSAPHRPDHRRIVEDAERACRDLGDAADFLEHDGDARLRAAVAAARRWEDDDVADRGETLLDSLARYRDAAASAPDEACPGRRSVSLRSHNPLRGGRLTR